MGTFKITQVAPNAENIFVYPSADTSGATSMTTYGDSPNYKCCDDDRFSTVIQNTYVYKATTDLSDERYDFSVEDYGGVINYVALHTMNKNDATDLSYLYHVISKESSVVTSVSGSFYDVVSSTTYIFVAAQSNGISAYTFDGTTLTESGTTDSYASDLFATDEYLFAACGTSGLKVFTFDGSTFTLSSATDDGGTYNGVYYDGTYIYTTDEFNGIKAYSFDGSNLALLDSDDWGGYYEAVTGDGTYIYAAMGTIGLGAYSFDGSTLTREDSVNDGGFCNDVAMNDDNTSIFCATYTDGIRGYSFDGSDFQDVGRGIHVDYGDTYGISCYGNLVVTADNTDSETYTFDGVDALINLQSINSGNGNRDVLADDGFIYVVGADGLFVFTFPFGTTSGNLNTSSSWMKSSTYFTENPTTGVSWEFDEISNFSAGIEYKSGTKVLNHTATLLPDSDIYVEWYSCCPHLVGNQYYCLQFPSWQTAGSLFNSLIEIPHDVYGMEDFSGSTAGTLNSIKLFVKWKATNGTGNQLFAGLSTSASTAGFPSGISTDLYKGSPFITSSHTYETFTWADINDLKLHLGNGNSNDMEITYAYAVVDYSEEVTAAMYMAQTYIQVNYTPEPAECYLNSPEEVSTNHARNVNMINFWNGSREVYDINRSGKSIILTGTEYADGSICTDGDVEARIQCVRSIAKNGSAITLDDFSLGYFNGTYHIKSFGWDMVGEKPRVYKWMLELEDTEL